MANQVIGTTKPTGWGCIGTAKLTSGRTKIKENIISLNKRP